MFELAQATALPGADLPTETMRVLDAYCAELSAEFREPGALLDRDPDAIDRFLHLRGVQLGQAALLPEEYRPPLDVSSKLVDAAATCHGAVVLWERFSHGDPGVLLGSPGPSLSGGVVRGIADREQYHRYFSRFAAAPTHTFFGLTEPARGSAATELSTTLSKAPDGEGWVLNGEKCYIGNGARAQIGVVFCRRAPGPWGIDAVLVDPDRPGFTGELLPSLGLRGARISRLRFDDVHVPNESVLGAHLPASRRGLHAAMRILYRFRPGIAAMALGCAQAACDYLVRERPALPKSGRTRLENLLDRVAAVRLLIHRVAADIDRGAVNVHRIGAVKAQGARLAEESTLLAAELLGPASLIEHPWLEKACRDVRAFEIMEGTANLQRLSVFQGLLKDTFRYPDPGAGAHEARR
jgi:alkylation response protein AidB-like acyl-CoA dehydrogenase